MLQPSVQLKIDRCKQDRSANIFTWDFWNRRESRQLWPLVLVTYFMFSWKTKNVTEQSLSNVPKVSLKHEVY